MVQMTSLWSFSTPQVALSTPASTAPTPDAFEGWSQGAQAAYLTANSTDVPPFLVLGDPSGAQVLATLGVDGTTVTVSPVPQSYSDALTSAAAPALSDFQSWPEQLQLSYLRAEGGSTQSVTFGSGQTTFTASVSPTGGVQVVTNDLGVANFWSTATVATSVASADAAAAAASTAAATAAAPTAAAFASWTSAAQAAFVAAQSQDTPASTVVGAPGASQVLASVLANGSVFSAPVPASYVAAVSNNTPPSLDDFRSWPNALQASYVRANGSGTPPSLTLTSANPAIPAGGGTVTATLNGSAVTLKSTGAAFAAGSDPNLPSSYLAGDSDILPPQFFALPQDQQQALVLAIKKNGANYPSSKRATDAENNIVDLTRLNDNTGTIAVPFSTDQGVFNLRIPVNVYSDFNDAPGGNVAAPTDLATWPPLVATTYMMLRGAPQGSSYPKSVELPYAASGGVGVTATLLSPGDQVQFTTNPGGFLATYQSYQTPADLGATPLALDTFLSWPSAAQQAFVTKLLGSGTTGALPLTSTSLGTVDIVPTTSNGAATGWTYQVDTSRLAVFPATLDVAAFQSVLTPAQQLAYLAANGQGSPPVLKIATASGTKVMSAAGTGGGVTLEPLPFGYSTPPASLDPATFATWSPAMRQSYIIDNGTSTTLPGGTRTLTAVVGPSGAPQITASLTSAGALVLVVTQHALSTTGMADNVLPYANLNGGVTGLNSVNQTVARILFPVLNGDPSVPGSTILPTNPQTDAEKKLVADFDTAPDKLDASTFGAWDSAVQLQYLRANDPQNQGLAIGIAGGANGVLHAFMSAPTVPQLLPQKVYVVEDIQKQDISTMALADQKKLAGMASFQTVAQSLGLIPDGIDSSNVTGIHAASAAQANSIIQGQFSTAFATIADPSTGSPSLPDNPNAMPAADEQVFEQELTLIQTQAATSAIFSPKDIQDKISAVITRFQRAYAFGLTANTGSYGASLQWFSSSENGPNYSGKNVGVDVTGNNNLSSGYSLAGGATMSASYDLSGWVTTWTGGLPKISAPTWNATTQQAVAPPGGTIVSQTTANGVTTVTVTYGSGGVANPTGNDGGKGDTSTVNQATFTMGQRYSNTDNDAGIASGYNVFMTQEKAILAQQNRAQALATGSGATQNLDVPNLVYLFQLYSNLTGEATLRADTEQVNQTNTQLQTYAVMQRIINQTVAHIGSDSSGTYALYGSADANGDFTPEEQAALAIFGNQNGSPPQSPIELLQGIQRPSISTSSTNKQIGSAWSQFGTELSDTVTLLNQNSQLKMNDINSETKAKDQNFDQANGALSKMSDVLNKIASSIG